MKYKSVPIEEIKPDPNQPRKTFDQEALKEMAVSIKNEGIINAIEIDEHSIIITGEQRWRAAKLAGIKEVPIKVIENLDAQSRFIRQVQENVHHNSMSALDTAIALENIRGWITKSPGDFARDKNHQGAHFQKGIKELHELLGMSTPKILEYLELLGTEGPLREALKDPKFPKSKGRHIKKAPKEYQKRLSDLVGTQKNMPREAVEALSSAINRAVKYGEKDKIEKLFTQNYDAMSGLEAKTKIDKIIPSEEVRVKGPADAVRFISDRIVGLLELLEEHPLAGFDDFHRPLVIDDLNRLGAYLVKYLKEAKKLE
jgi:ParB/RepB/Spo0J family partition protein